MLNVATQSLYINFISLVNSRSVHYNNKTNLKPRHGVSKGLTARSLQNIEIIQFKQFLANLQNLSLLAVQYPSSLQVHHMTLSVSEMKPPGRKVSEGDN